jgi:hypothetical protein
LHGSNLVFGKLLLHSFAHLALSLVQTLAHIFKILAARLNEPLDAFITALAAHAALSALNAMHPIIGARSSL